MCINTPKPRAPSNAPLPVEESAEGLRIAGDTATSARSTARSSLTRPVVPTTQR